MLISLLTFNSSLHWQEEMRPCNNPVVLALGVSHPGGDVLLPIRHTDMKLVRVTSAQS